MSGWIGTEAKTGLPKLPKLLDTKISKTGQTRGADDDEIFQNRVSRTSTVLIPEVIWFGDLRVREVPFENGYIVLLSPERYFNDPRADARLRDVGLSLGKNALLFYQQRTHWNLYYPIKRRMIAATSRTGSLGGTFVARIAATTAANDGDRINIGFTSKAEGKGAGIRVYEYASTSALQAARLQLEAIYWLCEDALEGAINGGMTKDSAELRKAVVVAEAEKSKLLDLRKLHSARVVDSQGKTVCPLCLEPLSAVGFVSRLDQTAGREVHDLTVTQVNLFHIEELKPGVFNHRPYNLGWGHHHCNVVVKDAGIHPTLRWMQQVVQRNDGLIDGLE